MAVYTIIDGDRANSNGCGSVIGTCSGDFGGSYEYHGL